MVEAALLMIWFSYAGAFWGFVGGAAWLILFCLAMPLIARRNSGPSLMAHIAASKRHAP